MNARTWFVLALLVAYAARASAASRVLDDFESVTPWQVQHTDDVSANLGQADGKTGKALRLDFNFVDTHGNPINGYVTAHRNLPLDLPANYEFSFWIRGAAPGRSPSAAEAIDGQEGPPINNLQFKLIDASGDNVWWLNQPDYAFPHEWRQIVIKKREIEFAWGPTPDRQLKHAASIEFVVSSGRDGGKGSVEFDQLALRELAPPDTSPLRPRPSASSSRTDSPPTAAVDGDVQTAWRSDPARGVQQHFDLDFGEPREVGGLIVHWHKGARAQSWLLQQSVDGRQYDVCGSYDLRSGDDDAMTLCDTPVRYVRLELLNGEARGYGIDEIEIKEADWGTTPNAYFQEMAKRAPRGAYPRGFVEQSYWTIVGVDGGAAPALMSEDGALEPRKGGWSIEPFLFVDGKRVTWADVDATQSLLDGYLPLPRVAWKMTRLELQIEAFARGARAAPQLVARYRIRNASTAAVEATLQLAIRPFQVNPPMQFLNAPGGVASVQGMHWDGSTLDVGPDPVWPLSTPDDFTLLNADGGDGSYAMQRSADGGVSTYDVFGRASGALVYKVSLPAGGARDIEIAVPMSGIPARPELGNVESGRWFEHERDAAAAQWRARLNRVTLKLPASAQRIADTLRTALAQILISRNGVALRPGTRSYARSWIRDGAMMAAALLRFGETDAVRDYVDWYAPHQFANGKVPCCVDQRGSDPVPENDSHGELIHAIAELYRFGGDRAELERNWPHIQAAVDYMDKLRASETGDVNPAFKGLLPASISHEGYSAKPMHSYWDDFWALTGYKDAAAMAQVLGKTEVARIAQARDAFANDLHESIATAAKARAIDYVPGSAELGDFDATSTTIALAPAGEQSSLPGDLLRNTFERYWREFVARRDGVKSWEDYTPYEWRTVGSFVRLGWRERAQDLIDFFFATGARPAGWNQWAEVVGRDTRKPRFIGDMPHAWVASDFMRSALDLFAYSRDGALVLAAGVPAAWLEEGVGVQHLPTPFGDLTYHAQRAGHRLKLQIADGIKPPHGFVLPWPLAGAPGATRINNAPAQWHDNELHIAAAPATITIELGKN